MLYKSQPYTLVPLSLRVVLSTSRRRKSLLLFFAHEKGLGHVQKIVVPLPAKIYFWLEHPIFKNEISKYRLCSASTLRILGFRNNWMGNRSQVVLKRSINMIRVVTLP